VIDESRRRDGKPYADPYLAGAALGVILLAAFAIAGRGLGASSAFATTAAGLTHAVAPARAMASPLFARYLDGDGPWRDWLLCEVLGVIIGGFLSAPPPGVCDARSSAARASQRAHASRMHSAAAPRWVSARYWRAVARAASDSPAARCSASAVGSSSLPRSRPRTPCRQCCERPGDEHLVVRRGPHRHRVRMDARARGARRRAQARRPVSSHRLDGARAATAGA
jgi:hypothetical protein